MSWAHPHQGLQEHVWCPKPRVASAHITKMPAVYRWSWNELWQKHLWFGSKEELVLINPWIGHLFSIWDELKTLWIINLIPLATIPKPWGSRPEHIFHLGACVFPKQQHGSFGDDCQIFFGILHDISRSRQKKNSAAQVSFVLTTVVAKGQMFLRSLHSKVGRFFESIHPEIGAKKQVKFILPNYFQVFFCQIWHLLQKIPHFLRASLVRCQPRWNDTATAQWCIQPRQRSQKQDAVLWCQGFAWLALSALAALWCFYSFCFQMWRLGGGLEFSTWILGKIPILSHFFRWVAQPPTRKSWLGIFCSPADLLSQVVVSRPFFAEMIVFYLRELVLWLLWRLGETRFNSCLGWGEGVSF